jgi:hypothetical protein
MTRRAPLLAALALLLLALPASAEETGSAGQIAWIRDLPKAFEAAAKADNVLLICINAKNCSGPRSLTSTPKP